MNRASAPLLREPRSLLRETGPDMLLCGHQPNYMPWLGFFHKMALADRFLLVDNVQFVKRGPFGWIHRNRIRTSDGWTWLSLPIITSGKFHQEIGQCRMDNRLPWRRKHWRAIETNYSKAPHFNDYAAAFHAIYEREWEYLADLAEEVIRVTAGCLGIHTPMDRSSAAGASGPAVDLIISMCEKTGADRYLSGVHGRDYLGDLEPFRRAGITVVFQEFEHPVYPQCRPGEFVSHLAALDLLFNTGPRARGILLDAGRIVESW